MRAFEGDWPISECSYKRILINLIKALVINTKYSLNVNV